MAYKFRGRRWAARALVLAVAFQFVPVAHADPEFYPVRPGTPAWTRLRSHAEMVQATQLPQRLVNRLRTEQLADAVLDYPLLQDALAFSSTQEGVEALAARFNGLSELLRRNDSGAVLLARYQSLNVGITPDSTVLEAGDHTYGAWELEMLLAQPAVLSTLSPSRREELLRTGRAHYDAKLRHAEVYGPVGLEPTAALLGRTLAVQEGWDWRASGFLRDAVATSPADAAGVPVAVDRHFTEPAVQHRIEDGVRAMDGIGFVATPRGSSVQVRVASHELSEPQIAASNNYVAETYPLAQRETDSSRRYNCHSYAFHSQAPGNNYWMQTPGDDTYWKDGSYLQWRQPEPYPADTRWSWANGDHSGIEIGTSGDIRSKWGQLPLMVHRWDYSPYDDSVINKYYPAPQAASLPASG